MIQLHHQEAGGRCPCCYEVMYSDFTVTNSQGSVHIFTCPHCHHIEADYEKPHRSHRQGGALDHVAGMLRVFAAECRAVLAQRADSS